MKVETTPVETGMIVAGVVIFVMIVFLIYHHREQLSLTRTEEGRLQLE